MATKTNLKLAWCSKWTECRSLRDDFHLFFFSKNPSFGHSEPSSKKDGCQNKRRWQQRLTTWSRFQEFKCPSIGRREHQGWFSTSQAGRFCCRCLFLWQWTIFQRWCLPLHMLPYSRDVPFPHPAWRSIACVDQALNPSLNPGYGGSLRGGGAICFGHKAVFTVFSTSIITIKVPMPWSGVF